MVLITANNNVLQFITPSYKAYGFLFNFLVSGSKNFLKKGTKEWCDV